jgi:DNA repair exonuclease SbcCD ATPase subunit
MILERITFRNILSYGNNNTTFEFGDIYNYKTIGIIGKNGNGKTSIFDALFYAFFNKPYRKINLTDLINRENGRDLYVAVEFKANGHQYKIERGMTTATAKSKMIKIWVDGKEENLDAHSKDIQRYIETQIIGVNEKIFRLIFMIGLGSFTSFFEHSLPERRAILEFIVGINVLSVMLKKVKKTNSEDSATVEKLKSKIEQHIGTREIYEEKVKDIKKLQESTDYTDDIKKLEKLIKQINSEIEKINVEKLKLDIQTLNADIEKIEEKRDVWINDLKQNKIFLKQNIDLLSFFEKNDVCPTCTQPITGEFKEDKIEDLSSDNIKLEKNIKRTQKSIEEEDAIKKEKDAEIQKLNEKITRFRDLTKDLNNNQATRESFLEKQRLAKEDSTKIVDEINGKLQDIKKDIKVLAKEGKELSKVLDVNKVIIETLNDDGVKKYIYDIILKQINKYINHYITEFNFNAKVKIESDLSEFFFHRIGENIQYASFSNGEKLIVNFSFVFGLLKFIEEFYGFKSNFLFFDEILDTSLDKDNKTFLLETLKRFDKNIIIISHDYTLDSLFNECYIVSKEDGFSTLTSTKA